jgi:hypothetical protein
MSHLTTRRLRHHRLNHSRQQFSQRHHQPAFLAEGARANLEPAEQAGAYPAAAGRHINVHPLCGVGDVD